MYVAQIFRHRSAQDAQENRPSPSPEQAIMTCFRKSTGPCLAPSPGTGPTVQQPLRGSFQNPRGCSIAGWGTPGPTGSKGRVRTPKKKFLGGTLGGPEEFIPFGKHPYPFFLFSWAGPLGANLALQFPGQGQTGGSLGIGVSMWHFGERPGAPYSLYKGGYFPRERGFSPKRISFLRPLWGGETFGGTTHFNPGRTQGGAV